MSSQAVRIFCLMPHGCSIAVGLKLIIDDLLTAAMEGIRGVNPGGRPIRLFIVTVAMMGDLPRAAEFIEVHARSAFTLCSVCCICNYMNLTLPATNY